MERTQLTQSNSQVVTQKKKKKKIGKYIIMDNNKKLMFTTSKNTYWKTNLNYIILAINLTKIVALVF